MISVPEIQKSIYYRDFTGEPLASIKDSPFLEVLKKGTEVLLLVDPINEYAITQLKEFGAKKLTFMFAKRVPSLRRLKKRRRLVKRRLCGSKNSVRSLRMLLAKRSKLEKVAKVTVSNRVTDSPCVLVTGQFNWSANMEHILKAQVLRESSMSSYMASKKTPELNPSDPIIEELKRKVAQDKTRLTQACLSATCPWIHHLALMYLRFGGYGFQSGWSFNVKQVQDPQRFIQVCKERL